MSDKPPALDQLELHADTSIDMTYGTLSAGLVAQLVSVARAEHAEELRKARAEVLREAADDWEALVRREKPPIRGYLWLNRRADQIERGE